MEGDKKFNRRVIIMSWKVCLKAMGMVQFVFAGDLYRFNVTDTPSAKARMLWTVPKIRHRGFMQPTAKYTNCHNLEVASRTPEILSIGG